MKCTKCGSEINQDACNAWAKEVAPNDTSQTIEWRVCVACLVKMRAKRDERDSANGPWDAFEVETPNDIEYPAPKASTTTASVTDVTINGRPWKEKP